MQPCLCSDFLLSELPEGCCVGAVRSLQRCQPACAQPLGLLACSVQGVTSPLAGQMFFRATLFSTFGAAKRWLGTNPDGSTRALTTANYYEVRSRQGVAPMSQGPCCLRGRG